MNNGNVCSCCGSFNENNSKFCINCGAPLPQIQNFNNSVNYNYQNMNVNGNYVPPNMNANGNYVPPNMNVNGNYVPPNMNNVPINNQKNNTGLSDKTFGIIALLLYFCAPTIISFVLGFSEESISSLSGMCSAAAIVILAIGKSKYPKSNFLNTVLWIILGCVIFAVVAFVLIFVFCAISCASYDWSSFG